MAVLATEVPSRRGRRRRGSVSRGGDVAQVPAIFHEDGTFAGYVHLAHEGVAVEIGEHLEAGDVIGRSGVTGTAKHPHLHFHVWVADGDLGRLTVPVLFDDGGEWGIVLQVGRSYPSAEQPTE